jgi:hypothetical protein
MARTRLTSITTKGACGGWAGTTASGIFYVFGLR